METIKIRYATPDDLKDITNFNAAMALETEKIKLDKRILSKGVLAVLNDKAKGFYLVAEQKGEVRACLMITTEWSDWRNGNFWWIQSVYVQKKYRHQGIYKALYLEIRKMISLLKDVVGIRLYVDNKNKEAQKAYQKLGMFESNYRLFEAK